MAQRSEGLAARVDEEIVAKFHGGSTNAAATYTGIPQPTMRRILKGQVPQATTLATLARKYGTTIEWLLTGKGEGPTQPERDVEGEVGEFYQMLDMARERLGLEGAEAGVVRRLPSAVFGTVMNLAFSIVRERAEFRDTWLRTPDFEAITKIATDAYALAARAWLVALGGLIERYGTESVRDVIRDRLPLLALGGGIAALPLATFGQIDERLIYGAIAETTDDRRDALGRTLFTIGLPADVTESQRRDYIKQGEELMRELGRDAKQSKPPATAGAPKAKAKGTASKRRSR